MLVSAAGDRRHDCSAAGIKCPRIFLQLAAATRAREFHSGLSSVFNHEQADYVQFEKEVRAMVKLLLTSILNKSPVSGAKKKGAQ